MEEDIKVIDLLELGKAVWKFKYFKLVAPLLGEPWDMDMPIRR